MSTKTLIAITDFCSSHNIEHTYITTLEEYGFVTLENGSFIPHQELPRVEKVIRLNREMNINFEGIDVILNLLEKLDHLSAERQQLVRRLRLHEEV